MQILPYLRQAHYYETDQMGIIHHANYIHWFEEARVDLLRQIGYPYELVERQGYALAVLSCDCEYRAMTRFADTLHVYCSVTPPRAAFACQYRVLDAQSGELKAMGASRHAVLTREGKPVALKKALPELYRLFLLLAEG